MKLSNGAEFVCAVLVALIAFACMFVAGFQQLFSSFAFYDDEGYLMLSLRDVLDGQPLYDNVYSQYGPAYYVLESSFHRITGLPITHDVTRCKTLAVWISVSLLSGWYTFRMTRRGVIAIAASVASFFHLDRLCMEPGHPQEICVLGMMTMLLLSTFVEGARYRKQLLILIVMGCIAGTVTMTKINVGGLLIISSMSGFIAGVARGRFAQSAYVVISVGMLCLPFLLAGVHVLTLRGMQLPVVTVMSILTVQLYVWKNRQPILRWTHVIVFLAAISVATLAFVVLTNFGGTSIKGIAQGVLLQHMDFIGSQYRDAQLYLASAAFAVLATVFAFLPPRHRSYPERLVRILLIAVVAGVSVRYVTESFERLTHGGMDRGHALLLIGFVTPSLWLLLNPREVESQANHARDHAFSRSFLCQLAILHSLSGYPMPGTQLAIASLPLLLALMIIIWEQCVEPIWLGADETLLRFAPPLLLAGSVCVTLCLRTVVFSHTRNGFQPLALPGASFLRLPDEEVSRIRWTVDAIGSESQTFLCYPAGVCSFYFWSEIDPPTGLNTTDWSRLLTPTQQHKIIEEIDGKETVCIVSDDRFVPPLADAPLVEFIQNHFRLVKSRPPMGIWRYSTVDHPPEK